MTEKVMVVFNNCLSVLYMILCML